MKILLIGPPASGKGTVGAMLSEKLGLPIVSVGKLLRALPESHPRYEELHVLMDAGELAPHDLTAQVLRDRLLETDCSHGYILDGCIRSMAELNDFNIVLDIVLLIDISSETTMKRISGRRVCEADNFTCNIYTMSPDDPHNCNKCSGELTQREDDKEEVVLERLEVYAEETLPVVEYFKKEGILKRIDGEGTPEEVFKLALKVLTSDSN